MLYCPVQVSISKGIQEYYNEAQNLQQVWDTIGNKIYEKSLRRNTSCIFKQVIDEVSAWSIIYKYFIYKPEHPDQNNNYVHLINLEKGNS